MYLIAGIVGATQDFLTDFTSNIFDLFNTCCNNAINYVKVSPSDFADGKPWDVVQNLMPTFETVAGSLAALFIMIAFIKSTTDAKEEIVSLQTLTKLFIRIGLVEGLVKLAINICQAIYQCAALLAGVVGADFTDLQLPDSYIDLVNDCDNEITLIGGFISSFLCSIVAAILGMALLFIVYQRIFKCCVIVPFSPMAFSTVTLGGGGAHVATSFIKTVISFAFEAVLIAISLALAAAVIGDNSATFDLSNLGETSQILLYPVVSCFNMGIIVGAVKGADSIVRRAMGV